MLLHALDLLLACL